MPLNLSTFKPVSPNKLSSLDLSSFKPSGGGVAPKAPVTPPSAPGFLSKAGSAIKGAGKAELGNIVEAGKGFVSDVGSSFKKRATDILGASDRVTQGKENIVTSGLEDASSFLGGAVDLIGAAGKAAYKATFEPIGKLIVDKLDKAVPGFSDSVSDTVKGFLTSPAGTKAFQLYQQGGDAWQKFEDAHPDVARSIAALASVAGNVAALAGGGVAEQGVKEGAAAGKEAILTSAKEAMSTLESKALPTARESAGKVLDLTTKRLSKAGDIIERAAGSVKSKLTKPEDEKIWSIIEPKLNAAEQADARAKGLITESKFGKTRLVPDENQKELISVAKNWIDPKKPLRENIKTVSNRVSGLTKDVLGFVKQRDAIYNSAELRKALESTGRSNTARRLAMFGNDKSLEDAYQGMVDAFMQIMRSKPNKLSSVLQGRKEFDSIAEQVIPKVFSEDARATVKKAAVRDIRQAANKFVVDRIKGGKAIEGTLKEQTQLLDVLENMAERAPKLGTGFIKRATEGKPIIQGALRKTGYVLGGALAGDIIAKKLGI